MLRTQTLIWNSESSKLTISSNTSRCASFRNNPKTILTTLMERIFGVSTSRVRLGSPGSRHVHLLSTRATQKSASPERDTEQKGPSRANHDGLSRSKSYQWSCIQIIRLEVTPASVSVITIQALHATKQKLPSSPKIHTLIQQTFALCFTLSLFSTFLLLLFPSSFFFLPL